MNYNKIKKEELIKALKERDVALTILDERNATLVKENDYLTVKIKGLTRDCEGMTEKCNNLCNKIEELKASLSAKHKQNTDLEDKLELASIEKSSALDKKRLYTGIIVLLLIGIVVLAIL